MLTCVLQITREKKYIAIYNTFCIARRVVKKIIKVSIFFKTAYK